MRTNQLAYIDESDFDEGFPQVLSNAYEGKLALDDYVNLIKNIYFARKSEYDLPSEIEWDKFDAGIEIKIREMLENSEEDTRSRQFISEDFLTDFSEEERTAYQIISKFRNSSFLMYTRNRNDYFNLIKTDFYLAFSKLSNRRFRAFDKDMAEVTAQIFTGCTNAQKVDFIREFREMWKLCPQLRDTDLDETVEGVQKLLDDLNSEKEKLDPKKKIAAGHFGRFIDFLQSLKQQLEYKMESQKDT